MGAPGTSPARWRPEEATGKSPTTTRDHPRPEEAIERPDGGAKGLSMERRPLAAVVGAAVAVAYALAAFLVRSRGFVAISDDDFARVVIAQSWAAHPALDPSGTSWLPVPFWLYGLIFRVAGSSLAVAWGAAILLAGASGALLVLGARRAGLPLPAAALGSLVPLLLPLVPLLGAAPVPELPTAALVAFALLAAEKAPVEAGMAILLASLSRYEPWPFAALVALSCGLRAARLRSPRHALAAALAAAGPLLWCLWNLHSHGDALSFAHRVASYRAGLGERAAEAGIYLFAFVREAPAPLLAFGLVALGKPPAALRLALIGPLVQLAALSLAGLAGGAPTHHPERALVASWLALSVAAAGQISALSRPRLRLPLAASGLALALFSGIARLAPTWSGLGADRRADLALGEALRARVPAGEKVLLVADSYGFLATDAAFARPGALLALVPRAVDPRSSLTGDPLASPEALAGALSSRPGVRWLWLPEGRAPWADEGAIARIPLAGGRLVRVR